MGINISKNYTVRVHYLDVKSNKTDILEEKGRGTQRCPEKYQSKYISNHCC